MKMLILTMSIGVLLAQPAVAADGKTGAATREQAPACGSPECCGHCGAQACCQKVCKVVCEIKEIKKVAWEVKCGDFCAPLPRCGHGCCESCGAECAEGATCCGKCKDCGNPCAVEEQKCRIPPTCGKVRPKKVLVKKEVTCKVPAYKCVVVYCCPSCCGASAAGEAVPGAAPPPPVRPSTAQVRPLPPLLGIDYHK